MSQKTRLKRLPMHSYSIILSFKSDEERDKCINLKEFQELYGKLIAFTQTNFNTKVETIKWDTIKGEKKVEK
ncbi:MAG: hypothetical protein ACTSU4_02310 [Promethearchaeota archaeon]